MPVRRSPWPRGEAAARHNACEISAGGPSNTIGAGAALDTNSIRFRAETAAKAPFLVNDRSFIAAPGLVERPQSPKRLGVADN